MDFEAHPDRSAVKGEHKWHMRSPSTLVAPLSGYIELLMHIGLDTINLSQERPNDIPTEVLPAIREVTLKAPLSGFSTPLERVPDPVFSQKMVGDGIA